VLVSQVFPLESRGLLNPAKKRKSWRVLTSPKAGFSHFRDLTALKSCVRFIVMEVSTMRLDKSKIAQAIIVDLGFRV